jgi:hypothetical protein
LGSSSITEKTCRQNPFLQNKTIFPGSTSNNAGPQPLFGAFLMLFNPVNPPEREITAAV